MTNITTVTTMTSREIAELTGKEHYHVMRDIRDLQATLEQNPDLEAVIKSTTYVGTNGQQYPQYELDKDTTLTLLTGYDAVARMKVIKRWQELEAKVAPALPENPVIAGLVTALYKVDELEREQSVIKQRVLQLEAKATTSPTEFYTVAGFAALKGIKMPTSQASSLGRKAGKLSRDNGIQIGKEPSAKYGTVNAYHIDVLEELFATI